MLRATYCVEPATIRVSLTMLALSVESKLVRPNIRALHASSVLKQEKEIYVFAESSAMLNSS